jgi:hypothetical protein
MGNHRNSLDEEIILKWLNIPLSKTFPCGKNHKDILTINNDDKSLDSHETKDFKATIKKDIPGQPLFSGEFLLVIFSFNLLQFAPLIILGFLR